MSGQIKITLAKSLIGRLPKHIIIANLLGLRKINATAIHQDTPAIRGMVNVIHYLLKVEDAA